MVSVFIDFADAFGSVEHEFIFETLESLDIPLIYCALIEDIYRYSSFAVICGCELSELFYIIRAGADPAQNLTYAQDRAGGGLEPPEKFLGTTPFLSSETPIVP